MMDLPILFPMKIAGSGLRVASTVFLGIVLRIFTLGVGNPSPLTSNESHSYHLTYPCNPRDHSRFIVGFLFSDVFSPSDMSDGLGPQQGGSLWEDLVVLFLSASTAS